MKVIEAKKGEGMKLGRCGENLARQVVFDVSEWEQVYGDGVAELLYQRKGDERPYVMEITREEGKVLWPITAWHTEVPGYGKCELRYYQGETLVKSAIWKTSVHAAMGMPTEEAPTEAEQGWLEQMLQTAAAAESAERVAGVKIRLPPSTEP